MKCVVIHSGYWAIQSYNVHLFDLVYMLLVKVPSGLSGILNSKQSKDIFLKGE